MIFKVIHTLAASLLAIVFSSASAFSIGDVKKPFIQEMVESFTVNDGLPDSVIHAIEILPDGSVIAATDKGISLFYEKKWQKWVFDPGYAVHKLVANNRLLWASSGDRLFCLRNKEWITISIAQKTKITALCPYQESLFMGTSEGLWLVANRSAKLVKNSPVLVRSLALFGKKLIVGTTSGLYLSATSVDDINFTFESLYPSQGPYSWAPNDVAALAAWGKTIWFGCRSGVGAFNNGVWRLFTGKEGLPYDHFTCAEKSQDSLVWFGTEKGALRYDGHRWAYRASRRWLPNDFVTDIATDKDGTVWVATKRGISRITPAPMTFADKAAYFQSIIDQRHTRMGFVVRCLLKQEGLLESARINHTDNDGLYTAMYGASQAFRYGATKTPEARQRAKQAFQALKMLTAVTSIPGFPARAMVPVDWKPNPNEGFTAEVNKRMKESDPFWKEILPRWPTSADGKYLWKCDTSSDEICGHYFFYGAYYDLVAETEQERQEVRSLVRAISDHIIDHDYRLVDHDGQPTRWANWSPEYVNSPEGWADRGLQSMEILSFMNVAHHITGDEKYIQAGKHLRDEHDYHINAISGRAVFPPNLVVPWDNNLAFLSYYGLLKYEQDPELLKLWQASIERNWLFASKQNDPFFTFVYLVFKAKQSSPILEATLPDLNAAFEKAVKTLQQTPLLLLGWEMKNSHRLDIVLDPTPGQRAGYGWSISGYALPIDERCHLRINSDHFDLDHEQGGGYAEYEGTFYLLPYYLGLYHGLLK